MTDIIGMFNGNAQIAKKAADIALLATDFGRGGVIRSELRTINGEQKLKYIMNATGQEYDSVQDAFVAASTLRVTQFQRVIASSGSVGDIANNPRRAQVGSIMEAMQNEFNFQMGNSQMFKDFILNITGQNPSSLDLSMDIVSTASKRGGDVKEFLQRAKQELGGYIPFASDEGVDILQFSVGGKKLSTSETHLLLSFLGNDVMNPSKVISAFGSQGTAELIEGLLGKLGKRTRAFTSERDINFTIQDILSVFEKDKFGNYLQQRKQLGNLGSVSDEMGVVIQEGLDVLRRNYDLSIRGVQGAQKVGARDRLVKSVMRNVDTEAIIASVMERSLIGEVDDTARQIKESKINKFLTSDEFRDALRSSQTNAELKKKIENFGNKKIIDKDIIDFLDDVMDTSEKEFDGLSVLNKKLFNGAKKTLKGQISQLKQNIQNGVGDIAKNKEALQQLENQLSMLNNAENLYQVTGRGQLGESSIKTAFDIRYLKGDLQNVLFVMGSSQLKGDVNIAKGTNMITLSGLGSPSELVYADPVTLAFHPEAFSTQADIENYQRYAAEISQQFQEAVNSNTLPKKIVNLLESAVKEDSSMLPVASRASRERYKELARQTLELHQSGIGPKNSPLMMNMLHSMFQTEAFKTVTKNGKEFFMPVLPDVNRLALATESTEAMAGGRSILGKYKSSSGRSGMSDITIQLANGQETIQELAKFRVSNNKVLLHAGAVKEFYNALGGFDLDDKGLPKLMTASYKDSQGKLVKDLMFTMIRQPSGPQETMYMSAALNDVETLRHFFDKESFIAELETKLGTDKIFDDLYDVLTNKQRKNIAATEADIKDAIVDVFDSLKSKGKASITEASEQVKQNIFKYGSSPLRNTELTSRFGLERILKDSAQQSDNMYLDFIRPKIQEILPKFRNQMDPQIYSDILNATSNQQLKNIISRLGQTFDVGLNASLQEAIFAFMEDVSTKDADILGVYVNRSMVAGSVLNQMEDFASMLDDAKIQKLQQYGMGLTLQELPIDRATTFSAQQEFLANISKTIARLDPTTGRILVENAFKVGMTVETTIDEIGEQAMENLGKMFGSATAMFYGENILNQDLMPVIDKVLLETRLTTQGDVQKILAGMVEGIKSTVNDFNYQDQRIAELLTQIKEASVSKERGLEFLMERFGAGAGHKYAAVASMAEQAAIVNAEMDAMVRLAQAGIVPDQTLLATKVSQEASNVADYLLDRNAKMLDELFSKSAKDMGQTEVNHFTLQKFLQSQRISAEISEASRITGKTQEEIINALEKRAYQRGINFRPFEKLDFADDQGISFTQRLGVTRSRRMRDFYRTTLSANQMASFEKVADIIRRGIKFEDLGDPQALANMGISSITTEEMQLLQDIEAGERSEANAIIRNINYEKGLDQQVVNNISQSTSAQVVGFSDDKFEKGVQAAADGQQYSRYLPDNTPYKRFMQYVKDGDLKNLFTENATFRRSVYAAGALIAGSFIYSAVKDHTPEKIQGPPLLPGGSAYEQQYPNRLAEIPQIGTVNYNPGVSYKVNLYGGRRDVENFRSMAMELGNFDMNTTMYSGIPDVGRDPYAEIASSY